MIKKYIKVNWLKTLAALLIISILANGTVYANKQQPPITEPKKADAETLLVQLKEVIMNYHVLPLIEEAESLSDQIVQTWPGSTHAMDALGEIGYLYAWTDDASANNVLTELYTKYSAQPKSPRAIDRVAWGYISVAWGYRRNVVKARAIYTKALTQMPDHPDVAWLHGGLIKCQIAQEDFARAEQSIKAFKKDYSTYPELCRIIYYLAEAYSRYEKFNKAKALYQYVSENSSDSDLALKVQAQIWVIGCEIRLGNYSVDDQAINALKNDYSEHKDHLCAALNELAGQYWIMKKFDKAKAIFQYISQNTSDSKLSIFSLAQIAKCEISLGNDSAAEQAINTLKLEIDALKDDYSAKKAIYKYLYSVGDVYWWLAKYDKGKALYQYIAQNTSDSNLAIQAQAWIVDADIKLGNDSSAKENLDLLFSKYLHHAKLERVLREIINDGAGSWVTGRLVNLVQEGQKPSVRKQNVMLCIELLGKNAADKSLDRYLALFSKNGVILEDIKEVLSFCEEKGKYSHAVRLCQYYLKHSQAGEDKEEIELRLYSNLLPNSQNPASMLPNLDKYILRNKETYKLLAAKATLLKGRILIFLGDTDKAIIIFKKMSEEFPGALETQEGFYLTGYCYLMQSEFEKSKNILSQLIKKYPSSEFVHKAQELIDRIEEMT